VHFQQQLLPLASDGPKNYFRYAANPIGWVCAFSAAAAANSFAWARAFAAAAAANSFAWAQYL